MKCCYSPLRYPGGKAKLYDFIESAIKNINCVDTYIEPFAGGAAIAIGLLVNGIVQNIVINDINIGIYSFWESIVSKPKEFIELIKTTPVSINTFKKQKEIYYKEKKYSLKLGFATFFLNRTCFSGVLNSGPIGGYSQKGSYKINARYNKNELINRIELISKYSKNIYIYNMDINNFFSTINKFSSPFIYFDPPYYVKGEELYTNFFTKEDHKTIAKKISKIKEPWILTYDNVEEIKGLYKNFDNYVYNLCYTASMGANKRGSELLYTNKPTLIRKIDKNIKHKIKLLGEKKNGNK